MLSEVFKSSYTKAELSREGVSSLKSGKSVAGLDQSQNPVLPPVGNALHLDDIEGFGEWPIMLSTRAQKDLRDFRRADGAMFRIVMKKIRWDLTLRFNDRY